MLTVCVMWPHSVSHHGNPITSSLGVQMDQYNSTALGEVRKHHVTISIGHMIVMWLFLLVTWWSCDHFSRSHDGYVTSFGHMVMWFLVIRVELVGVKPCKFSLSLAALPLLTWAHSTRGVGVAYVQWVGGQPGVFLAQDRHSTVYLWWDTLPQNSMIRSKPRINYFSLKVEEMDLFRHHWGQS